MLFLNPGWWSLLNHHASISGVHVEPSRTSDPANLMGLGCGRSMGPGVVCSLLPASRSSRNSRVRIGWLLKMAGVGWGAFHFSSALSALQSESSLRCGVWAVGPAESWSPAFQLRAVGTFQGPLDGSARPGAASPGGASGPEPYPASSLPGSTASLVFRSLLSHEGAFVFSSSQG